MTKLTRLIEKHKLTSCIFVNKLIKMNSKKIVSLLILSSLLISSCGVEYVKTADVQAELQQTLNKINSEKGKLEERVKRSNQELTPYQICSDTTKNFSKAKAKISQLEANSLQLKSISGALEAEMKNFTSYTNGKPVIVSKMTEWQKLSQTRQLFKDNSAKWDAGNKALDAQGNGISAFIKDTLAPSLKKANPNDYLSKLSSEVNTLEGKVNGLTQEFTGLKSSVTDKISKYKRFFPDVVKKIEAEMSGIQSKYDALMTPVKELNEVKNNFKNKTAGMSVIYSCQKEWKEMLQLDGVIMEKAKKITNIEAEIKDKRKIIDALLAKLL